jgi:hypothetical protein
MMACKPTVDEGCAVIHVRYVVCDPAPSAVRTSYPVLLLPALGRQLSLDGVHTRRAANAGWGAPLGPGQAQRLPWLPGKQRQLPHQREARPTAGSGCKAGEAEAGMMAALVSRGRANDSYQAGSLHAERPEASPEGGDTRCRMSWSKSRARHGRGATKTPASTECGGHGAGLSWATQTAAMLLLPRN